MFSWTASAYLAASLDGQRYLGPYKYWRFGRCMTVSQTPYWDVSHTVVLPPSDEGHVFLKAHISTALGAMSVPDTPRRLLRETCEESRFFSMLVSDLLWLITVVTIDDLRRDANHAHFRKRVEPSARRSSALASIGAAQHYVSASDLQRCFMDLAGVDLDAESSELLIEQLMLTQPPSLVSLSGLQSGSPPADTVRGLTVERFAECRSQIFLSDLDSHTLESCGAILWDRVTRWACLVLFGPDASSTGVAFPRHRPSHQADPRWIATLAVQTLRSMQLALWIDTETVYRPDLTLSVVRNLLIGPSVPMELMLSVKPPPDTAQSRVVRRRHGNAAASNIGVGGGGGDAIQVKRAGLHDDTAGKSSGVVASAIDAELRRLFAKPTRPQTSVTTRRPVPSTPGGDAAPGTTRLFDFNAHTGAIRHVLGDRGGARGRAMLTPAAPSTLERTRNLHLKEMRAIAVRRGLAAVARYNSTCAVLRSDSQIRHIPDHLEGAENYKVEKRKTIEALRLRMRDAEARACRDMESVRDAMASIENAIRGPVSFQRVTAIANEVDVLDERLQHIDIRHVATAEYRSIHERLLSLRRETSSLLRARLDI